MINYTQINLNWVDFCMKQKIPIYQICYTNFHFIMESIEIDLISIVSPFYEDIPSRGLSFKVKDSI